MKIIFLLLITTSIVLSQNRIPFENEETVLRFKNTFENDTNKFLRYHLTRSCNSDFRSLNILNINDSDIYKSNISAGIGYVYLFNSYAPIRPMLSLYYYSKFIIRNLYLGIGTDIYSEPRFAASTLITINIIPSFSFDIFQKKFLIYIGGGFCIYEFPRVGSIISFRTEYNIYNKISSGLDFKFFDMGETMFSDHTLLLNQIFVSLKF